MTTVAVYKVTDLYRSHTVCEAMAAGIKACGDSVSVVDERQYRGVQADVAVFYGLHGALRRVFKDYGKRAVYIDLGYWGRREGGRWVGFHKISVGDRHPTAYFQKRQHPPDRLAHFGIQAKPWRAGNHILVAGMGHKVNAIEHVHAGHWEADIIREIRKYSDRPIIYRPKPSWNGAKPIAGTRFSPKEESVMDLIAGAHAVVTHHSNTAVEGLAEGVPAFCWHGVAASMALQDVSRIERPWRPEGRQQWLQDIAYTQFSIAEMRSGIPWRHLKSEALV